MVAQREMQFDQTTQHEALDKATQSNKTEAKHF